MPRSVPLPKLTIVKLGGSLVHGWQCWAWLDVLAEWGGPLILVPGGGPFADCVRAAQGVMGFADSTAHRLALIAMGQFGLALAARSVAFTAAKSTDELDRALVRGKIPVWLPEKMVLETQQVPSSWEVTSDSLAAWLAGTYGASRLLLIKSCDLTAPTSAVTLAARNIVDPAFPRFAAEAQVEVWFAGPQSLAGARSILQGGGMPGSRIAHS